MINEIINLKNTVKRLLTEAARSPHPEDFVFSTGTQGAQQALDYFTDIASNPGQTTVKWDGYPALVFGHGPDGKFSITDKHMFDKKDGTGRAIYSPSDFVKYDAARGVERSGLNNAIANMWRPLAKQTEGTEGYYWGDLLFSQPLKPQNGFYTFKANPKGLTYKIKADSDIGKMLQGKIAGIAVHQYIAPDAVSTSQAQSLNGSLGQLNNDGQVALLPASLSSTPNVKLDQSLIKKIQSEISQNGKLIDDLFANSPVAQSTLSGTLSRYVNKRVEQGSLNNLLNEFFKYLKTTPDLTNTMRVNLTQYFTQNKNGLKALFQIWADLYNLKLKVKDYFDKVEANSPIQAYNDAGEKVGHEGYFYKGNKLVDRMKFTHNLFKGR